MADDIQSAGKEMVNSAMEPPKKKSEWKHLAFLTVGLVIGMLIGYQMNLEKSAQSMAVGICKTCQDNLGIMVGNFNVLAKTCSEAQQYQRNISILPGVINQTVSVYAS